MSYVYLCSPYTHESAEVRHDRYIAVCRAARALQKRGYPVFSPICHSHGIEIVCDFLEGHEYWMNQDLPLLCGASQVYVLMLDGWEQSRGIAAEIAEAERLGKPIIYISPEGAQAGVSMVEDDIESLTFGPIGSAVPHVLQGDHYEGMVGLEEVRPGVFRGEVDPDTGLAGRYDGLTMIEDQKPTNPKDLVGTRKVPMGRMPDTAISATALAFLEGALKYGQYNWRICGVKASVYKDALNRHFGQWFNGEECDPVTGVPHLGSAIACLAILIDAQAIGKLIDDRPPSFHLGGLLEQHADTVERLIELYGDRNPRHYTIEDQIHATGVRGDTR